MDQNEFEEILKKQLELETDEHEEESKTEEEILKYMTGLLGMKSMIELGQAARKRTDKVIEDLKKDLLKSDGPAMKMFKINRASKELDILRNVVSISAFTGITTIGGDKEFDADTILETVVRIGML